MIMAQMTISDALDALESGGSEIDAIGATVWGLAQTDWLIKSAEGHGLAAYLARASAPYLVRVSGPTVALAAFVDGLFTSPIPALTLSMQV